MQVDDSEIKAMDNRISELTQVLQKNTEEVRQLESGKNNVIFLLFTYSCCNLMPCFAYIFLQ